MNVYIGATRQNDGKTITCLGLISAFKKRVDRVGYIKPVGQRYVEVNGHKIDEDAAAGQASLWARGGYVGYVAGRDPAPFHRELHRPAPTGPIWPRRSRISYARVAAELRTSWSWKERATRVWGRCSICPTATWLPCSAPRS